MVREVLSHVDIVHSAELADFPQVSADVEASLVSVGRVFVVYCDLDLCEAPAE